MDEKHFAILYLITIPDSVSSADPDLRILYPAREVFIALFIKTGT
jgi:hypothetical protein